jgi:hypothetical protein
LKQILADEDAWKKRFAGKRDVIRRMSLDALQEDERGETRPLDELVWQDEASR